MAEAEQLYDFSLRSVHFSHFRLDFMCCAYTIIVACGLHLTYILSYALAHVENKPISKCGLEENGRQIMLPIGQLQGNDLGLTRPLISLLFEEG